MRLVVVILALAACNATLRAGKSQVDAGYRADSGDESDPDGGGGSADASFDGASALTASQMVVKYDANTCAAAFACKSNYPGTNSQFTQYFGNSQSDCVTQAAAYDVPATIDGDVTAGVIHFDPVQGAACVAGLGYQCGTFWNTGPTGDATCQAAIMGTIADGATCKVDWDCSSWTSYCDSGTKKCTASN